MSQRKRATLFWTIIPSMISYWHHHACHPPVCL